MPLKEILAEVSADIGVDINSPSQYDLILAKINSAAKDLYTQYDLYNCLREQMFEIGAEDQQISLPYYVYEVRGVRDNTTKVPIKLYDMQPRYQTEGWSDNYDSYTWRIKQQNSPVKAGWLCDGPLKFTLSKAASKDFTINVLGQTPLSTRLQETLTVLAGTVSVTTTNTFIAGKVEAITKSVATDEDISVTAIDDTVIAEIPNCELFPSYMIVQVLDRDQMRSQSQIVEVLYKIRFTPFVNDYDIFPCGDIYNEAIYWNTLAMVFGKNEGDQWIQRATIADAKAKDSIAKIAANRQVGRKARMDFGVNRWRDHARNVWNNRWCVNRFQR